MSNVNKNITVDAKLISPPTFIWTYKYQCLLLILLIYIQDLQLFQVRSQWPRSLRRGSAAARLLRLWVRIPPGAWMCCLLCECCVLLGKGLCDELITRPEEFYRLRYVVVCDLEASSMKRPWPAGGYCSKNKQNYLNSESKKS